MKKKATDTSLKDFLDALNEIEKIKGINKEELIVAVESALVSAYKKDNKSDQSVIANIDRETGVLTLFVQKNVVEEVEDPSIEIILEDAKKINANYEVGDIAEIHVNPKNFGRIAAQNAKQLIIQKIKEAERNIVNESFTKKKDEMITGVVQREERKEVKKVSLGETVVEEQRIVYVNLGKAEGVLTPPNQIKYEEYYAGMRLKVYVCDVIITSRGPQIMVSRTHPGLLKRLFEEEVTEIGEGIVEIKSISREAGSRSKMAVYSEKDGIDPVGTCIGPKGLRIQNIVNELSEEKIDVIKWSEDPVEYISNALSPAEVLKVEILETDEEEKNAALVVVDDSQLSLAIGKDGQNVRLAARLTGWKIDIKSKSEYDKTSEENSDLTVEE